MRFFLIILTLLLFLSSVTPSYSVVEEAVSFDNPKTEKRYKKLIAELRCLVCQNQSLADSDAELAKDLRRKTVEMLKNGASNKDVRKYMTDRYGDFVLYRPPFTLGTAILWLGPFILLIGVIIVIVINIRKRQQDELYTPARANNEQNTVKVRNLLKNTPQLDSKYSDSKPEDKKESQITENKADN